MRDSIVFYRSFFEAISELPDEDQLAAYQAVVGYAMNGIEPEVSGTAKAIFLMAKPQIDANNQRYANGKKGGAPKGNSNAQKTTEEQDKTTENQPKTTDEADKTTNGCFSETTENNIKQPNVFNVFNENENVNVNEKSKRFSAPTLEEVRNYCAEKRNSVDPELFFNYYESNDWHVGRSKMKNWKSAISTWEQRNKSPSGISGRVDSVAESFLKGASDYDT